MAASEWQVGLNTFEKTNVWYSLPLIFIHPDYSGPQKLSPTLITTDSSWYNGSDSQTFSLHPDNDWKHRPISDTQKLFSWAAHQTFYSFTDFQMFVIKLLFFGTLIVSSHSSGRF